MKRKELEKRLRQAGWRLAREGKKHSVWSDGEDEVAVPRHTEINEHTARSILRFVRGGKQ